MLIVYTLYMLYYLYNLYVIFSIHSICYIVYTLHTLYCLYTLYVILSIHSIRYIVYTLYMLYCLYNLYVILSIHSIRYIVYTLYMLYCLYTLYVILSIQSICYIVYTLYTLYCLYNLYVILSIQSICYIVYTLYTLYCLYTLYVILSINYTWALLSPCAVAGGSLVRVRMWSLLLIGVCTSLVFRCEHVLFTPKNQELQNSESGDDREPIHTLSCTHWLWPTVYDRGSETGDLYVAYGNEWSVFRLELVFHWTLAVDRLNVTSFSLKIITDISTSTTYGKTELRTTSLPFRQHLVTWMKDCLLGISPASEY
jgi:hypothetical protein